MGKIIGIDTGGTYTDLVVIDAEHRDVLAKNKTLTTKTDLKLCIQKSFESVPKDLLDDVSMVCLSTTLATNAIVEGHGCKVGLILIGGRPHGKMISRKVSVIKGKYDIKGRVKENLDTEEVHKVVEAYRGKVDAIAISGYASVRNPKHELYVKQVVEQSLGVPVACAHELTSSLGFYDRTVTVNLNAKLIPMICQLMDAVRHVMDSYNIKAPLMIVKGDGNLMTDVCAQSKPIETILSGPASSVIGGMYISGENDGFVIDIGGTTTDIANVSDGKLTICDEGARVGGWFTRVRAAEVYTVGLGGDSRITIDPSGAIKIEPEKSIPLSLAVGQYPDLKNEYRKLIDYSKESLFSFRDHEAYILVKKYKKLSYSDEERIIIEILRYMPHTLDYLKKNISLDKLNAVLDSLVREGVIMRISLTPTDILHLTGELKLGDCEVVELTAEVACRIYKKSRTEFLENVTNTIIRNIDTAVIRAALYFDNRNIDSDKDELYDYFVNDLFFERKSKVLEIDYKIPKKLIGIGAPANAWLAKAGAKLNTKIHVPENAEVANAIGAAIGKAVETIEVLIRPDSLTGKYLIYSPIDRSDRETLEEATEYAFNVGEECIKRLAENRQYSIKREEEDMYFEDIINETSIFMERKVLLSVQFNHKKEERE